MTCRGGPDLLRRAAQRVFEEGQQQFVLAVELQVEASQRLPRAVNDFLDGEVRAALLDDDGLRGIQERWTRCAARSFAVLIDRSMVRCSRPLFAGSVTGGSNDCRERGDTIGLYRRRRVIACRSTPSRDDVSEIGNFLLARIVFSHRCPPAGKRECNELRQRISLQSDLRFGRRSIPGRNSSLLWTSIGRTKPDARASLHVVRPTSRAGARRWQRLLFDRGWLLPEQPARVRWSRCNRVAAHVQAEVVRTAHHKNFNPQGVGIIAASLLSFGTAGRSNGGRCRSCGPRSRHPLGMSEPGAGSDLASLRDLPGARVSITSWSTGSPFRRVPMTPTCC